MKHLRRLFAALTIITIISSGMESSNVLAASHSMEAEFVKLEGINPQSGDLLSTSGRFVGDTSFTFTVPAGGISNVKFVTAFSQVERGKPITIACGKIGSTASNSWTATNNSDTPKTVSIMHTIGYLSAGTYRLQLYGDEKTHSYSIHVYY